MTRINCLKKKKKKKNTQRLLIKEKKKKKRQTNKQKHNKPHSASQQPGKPSPWQECVPGPRASAVLGAHSRPCSPLPAEGQSCRPASLHKGPPVRRQQQAASAFPALGSTRALAAHPVVLRDPPGAPSPSPSLCLSLFAPGNRGTGRPRACLVLRTRLWELLLPQVLAGGGCCRQDGCFESSAPS